MTKENYVVAKDKEERTEDWSQRFLEAENMRSWLQQILCHNTIHSCHDKNKTAHQNYVATLSKSIAIESKKKLRKPVAIETVGYEKS